MDKELTQFLKEDLKDLKEVFLKNKVCFKINL